MLQKLLGKAKWLKLKRELTENAKKIWIVAPIPRQYDKKVKTIENGPREIDLDIIFYGGESYSDEDLCIPHKRWRERDFVVTPLLDLLDAGFFDSGFFSEQRKLLKTMSRLYPPFSAF